MPQPELITDQQSWERVASLLSEETVLALDTEANSLYAYKERICLVQIAARSQVFLLDPLAVKDLSALGVLLADSSRTKVLHGSDYDLRSLDRDYGFRVRSLFDTEIAARFLGATSPNLAAVLETFLEVSILKSKRLQRSNWGLRPLSGEAQVYAASDVAHLNSLAQELKQRLDRLGRLAWVEEECARLEEVRYTPPAVPENAFLRIRGSEGLSPRSLAVLQQLFLAREKAAERANLPPFRIMGNEALVLLARNPSVPRAASLGAHGGIARRFGQELAEAVERGWAGPEFIRPPRPNGVNPWDVDSRARLRRLKEWRTRQGAALQLDPALLWPASSLERLALDPAILGQELQEGGASGEVRQWQRQHFAEQVKRGLEGAAW